MAGIGRGVRCSAAISGGGFDGAALAILTPTCAEVLFDPAHQGAIAVCDVAASAWRQGG